MVDCLFLHNYNMQLAVNANFYNATMVFVLGIPFPHDLV